MEVTQGVLGGGGGDCQGGGGRGGRWGSLLGGSREGCGVTPRVLGEWVLPGCWRGGGGCSWGARGGVGGHSWGAGWGGCWFTPPPPPPQVEDLKNKNLILRAQLRQHGVEIVIKNDTH